MTPMAVNSSTLLPQLSTSSNNRDDLGSAAQYVDNPLAGIDTSANGNTYRGIFSSWFNNANIERENFNRSEQSAQNSFLRDLYLNQYNNKFNADEAQKVRDFQVDFAKNSYKYAVEGMQAAGLNPILAYQQGAVSAPSSPSASSGGSRSYSSNYRSFTSDPSNSVLAVLGRVLAGLITKGASEVAMTGKEIFTRNPNDPIGTARSTSIRYSYGKK